MGLFAPVEEDPSSWTYRTVAQTGEAWGLRYSFAEPPSSVVTLARAGDRVRGVASDSSSGARVEVRSAAGCGFETTLPFDRPLPASSCPLRLAVSPSRVLRGRRTRLRFDVFTDDGDPVAGARIFLGRRTARTNARGVARITYRFLGRARERRPSAWLPGRQPGRATIRVLEPPRRPAARRHRTTRAS